MWKVSCGYWRSGCKARGRIGGSAAGGVAGKLSVGELELARMKCEEEVVRLRDWYKTIEVMQQQKKKL